METDNRRRAWHWKAILGTDECIRQFKRFDVVLTTFRAAIVLLQDASAISRLHKPTADDHRPTTSINGDNVLEYFVGNAIVRCVLAGGIDVARNIYVRRKQTQAKAVHRGSSLKHWTEFEQIEKSASHQHSMLNSAIHRIRSFEIETFSSVDCSAREYLRRTINDRKGGR
jgi:hypothetical protein